MSIRFKFRSAVSFDTVEIGDRPSISVLELRARILRLKNSQQQQQGFDLVLSDAASGLEYKGGDVQIPRGSSVIVKRVPCGSVPSALPPVDAGKTIRLKDSHALNPSNKQLEEFDDFGSDLCPIINSNLPRLKQVIDKSDSSTDQTEDFKNARLGGQDLVSDDINKSISKGSGQSGNEKHRILEARVEEQQKLNKLLSSNFLAVQNANFPSEMKCPLCRTFFKDAVMIPCCQHSFCEKCIHMVLVGKGRCPRCFSGQFKVEDLLPNLSLRRAIEHFLESQMLDDCNENHDMKKYVPDGESGIQVRDPSCAVTVVQREVRDPSCAVTVVQRELEIPQSSCATGRGSNQIIESNIDQQAQRNLPFADSADSSVKRKKSLWVDTKGGDGKFSTAIQLRKGVRKCYTCGSPDHLMRDCPASNPNLMYFPGNEAFNGGMPGYAPPYWNSSSLSQFEPFAHMYRNHAMMPYNASMVPVSPFAMPPYIAPMCGGFPGPRGSRNIGMGNMEPLKHPEFYQLQHCENRKIYSNDNLEREQLSEGKYVPLDSYQHYSPQKSPRHLPPRDEEHSLISNSEESFARRAGKKSQREKHLDSNVRYADERHERSSHSSLSGIEKRQHHVERSNSSKENLPRSSDRYGVGRQKHHGGDVKKHHETIGHSEAGHHTSHRGLKKREESDIRDSHKRHLSHSECAFEPSSPTAPRRGYRERDPDHDLRHSNHSRKHSRDRHCDVKCKIADHSDKDHTDEHRYRQRRRVY